MQQPQSQNVPQLDDNTELSAVVVLDDQELAQVSGGLGPNGGWSCLVAAGPNGGW
jgi:lactobin A/cerein 7B family class IIb bacteriocin